MLCDKIVLNTIWSELIRPKFVKLVEFNVRDVSICTAFLWTPLNNYSVQSFDSLIKFACEGISDENLLTIAEQCKHLAFVHLTAGNKNVTKLSLIPLFEHNSSLTEVCLFSKCLVCDDCVYALSTHCKKLKKVQIDNSLLITDDSITTLLRKCHVIENLYLSGCQKVTKETVRTALTFGRNLLHVNVKQTEVTKSEVWWLRRNAKNRSVAITCTE
jgi:hypothetical protein